MRDPLRPAPGAANIGAAALGRSSDRIGNVMCELGEVLAYNSATHTSVVRTHSGRPLKDVPQIKGTAGGFDHIPTGTTVVVFWGLGFPTILGCIDMPGQLQSAIPSPTLTSVEGVGDADPTQATQGSNNYKPPGAPTDMTQGDWAQVGTLGNHVAVMEGGLTSFGSPTALLQSLATTGTLRSIARRIQQFTDFGQLTIENDQGKTSLILRAGANQTAETGKDEQHWTIRLDLGATGDLFDFKIVEPEGGLLFQLHAGSDGHVQIYGNGGVDLSSGAGGTANMRHDIDGDRIVAITGDDTTSVDGLETHAVDGSSTRTIGGDATRTVVGSATEFVGGDRDVGVTGNETHITGENRATKIGGDDDTTVDGNATITARLVNTLEGLQIKFGKNAVEPLIKGTSFGTSFIAQVSSAATTLATAAATASTILSAPPGAPTTTGPALAALLAGISSAAAMLLTGTSAYASTLSRKVKTE